MSDIQFVYITAGSLDEAKNIGNILVSERLAACVNIIDNMHSMYWWEEKVQVDQEVVVIAKTTEKLIEELISKVKKVHSYDCPCILALPAAAGNPDFLEWIKNETK